MIDEEKLTAVALQEFINSKLADIANKLMEYVLVRPESFNCGHAVGYKQALLDIERAFDRDEGDL